MSSVKDKFYHERIVAVRLDNAAFVSVFFRDSWEPVSWYSEVMEMWVLLLHKYVAAGCKLLFVSVDSQVRLPSNVDGVFADFGNEDNDNFVIERSLMLLIFCEVFGLGFEYVEQGERERR